VVVAFEPLADPQPASASSAAAVIATPKVSRYLIWSPRSTGGLAPGASAAGPLARFQGPFPGVNANWPGPLQGGCRIVNESFLLVLWRSGDGGSGDGGPGMRVWGWRSGG
jgi:hypothetical protein